MFRRITSPQGLSGSPLTVTVEQVEGSHDIAVIRVRPVPHVSVGIIASDTPVLIEWSSFNSGWAKMYGYIDHSVTTHDDEMSMETLARYTEITCVGASYPLKTEDTASWSNVTSEPVVRDIADRFGLGAVVDPHSYVWPNIAQGGRSYWKLLSDMAAQIGYSLYCQDALIYFVDRRLARARTVTPKKYRVGGTGAVQGFKPMTGDGLNPMKESGANYSIHGTSTGSGKNFEWNRSSDTHQLLGSKRNPPLFKRVVHHVADSLLEATTHLDGAIGSNLFPFEAEIVLEGDPTVRPGAIIELTFNIEEGYEGLWYVKKASHYVAGVTYTTKATIGKDAFGAAPHLPSLYEPQLRKLKRKNLPHVVYRNGRWTAAWSTRRPQ